MATLVVNKGKEVVVSRAWGVGSFGVPQHIGWGTGAGTAGATDTDLFTAATEARVSGTVTVVTTTTTNDTAQVVGTITANGTKTITNVGLFDAAGSGSPPSGGNLVMKGDFTGIALVANETITFTLKIQAT